MPNPTSALSAFLQSPAGRRTIAQLVSFLVDLDDEVRREAVADARLVLRRPLLGPVLDGLLRRLRHDSPAMRQRAANSLAGLGPLAAPTVVGALARGRDALVRRRLAGVLAAMGPHLEQGDRLELTCALESVQRTARSATLASDCADAIKALRHTSGGG
ncbi:MAG TPA: hypothetical protein VFW33_16120 [Gemmataceae bacterium]|nr:hypothetical protein [Gemmataceae bacterium]